MEREGDETERHRERDSETERQEGEELRKHDRDELNVSQRETQMLETCHRVQRNGQRQIQRKRKMEKGKKNGQTEETLKVGEGEGET